MALLGIPENNMAEQEPFDTSFFKQPTARVVYVVGEQAPQSTPEFETLSSAELTEELEEGVGPDKFSLATVSLRELRSHAYEVILLLSDSNYQPPSKFGYQVVTSLNDRMNKLIDAGKRSFDDVTFEEYLNQATRQLEPTMLQEVEGNSSAQEQVACLIDAREWLRWVYSNTWDLQE